MNYFRPQNLRMVLRNEKARSGDPSGEGVSGRESLDTLDLSNDMKNMEKITRWLQIQRR